MAQEQLLFDLVGGRRWTRAMCEGYLGAPLPDEAWERLLRSVPQAA